MIVLRKRERQRTIASDSAETLLLKVLLHFIALGASVVISRGLGPEARGEYYLPVVAAAAMVSFCKLGLDQANVFLLGTRGVSATRLSGQNGLVAAGMGGLGLLLLLGAPSVLPTLFADIPTGILLLAALSIPFSLHTLFSAGLITLSGQVTWQFRASLLAGSLQVALLLGLLLARRLTVAAVLWVNLVTVVLTWGLTLWGLGDRARTWMRWDAALLRDTLKQSLLLHVGMVLLFLHLRLDMFMVKGLLGAAALGHYSLSVGLAEAILLATDSLAIAILPRQMGSSLEDAASRALHGARTSAILGAGLAALWAAGGGVVIGLAFGPAFAPAYLPLVGLLPGIVFFGMQRVCGAPTLRAGRPARFAAICAISLLCNTLLNLWWIPTWGILGASLASSLSYGLGAVLFLAWTARLAGASLSKGVFPRRSDWSLLWHAGLQGIHRIHQSYLMKKQTL